MTRAHSGWLLGVMVAIGCAHKSPPPPPAPQVEAAPPPAARVKMAVLPVDASDYPAIAQSLNNVLHDVKVKGVDDYFLSKATLEVVQLSIECVEQTAACYSAAGKQLGANKLLLGRITSAAPPKKKRDKSVRVIITLFDVDTGEAVNVAERVYRTPEAASQGATDLVAEAAGDPPAYFGPELETAKAPAGGKSVARGGK
jgi:hypothetical protein